MSVLVLEHRWKLVYISPLKKAKRKNTDTVELEIGVSHLLINKQVVTKLIDQNHQFNCQNISNHRQGSSYAMASVSRGDYGGYGGYASFVCPAPAADVGAGDFLNPNLLLILAAGAGALGGMTISI